tara:strand:+ start:2581 stop:3708 length:1128 start_codon:yes stop_codon:yes gene_type:complete
MKKLLILTNFFKPGFMAGGPIKSIDLICKNLKDNFDILVVTSSKDLGSNKNYDGVQLDKIITSDGYKTIYLSKYNIFHILFQIKEFKPNFLYLNSLFALQNVYLFLLNRFIKLPKIILAPRGEISINSLKIKKLKKKITLWVFKILKIMSDIDFQATDKFEANFLKETFPKNDITIIENFVAEVNKPCKEAKNIDHINMCFASRISEKKNLKFALKILNHERLCNYKLNLDIWGPIEDYAYWKECEDIIVKLPKNIIVKYMGTYTPLNQSSKLSNYQLLILPTLNENFGHIIFESMQLGIVPLISNNTPWTEINKLGAGSFNLDDEYKFINYLIKFAQLDDKNFSKVSEMIVQYACKNSNKKATKEKYISFFNEK